MENKLVSVLVHVEPTSTEGFGGNTPPEQVSMPAGSRKRAGTLLGAGSHRKGFSDPSLLRNTN